MAGRMDTELVHTLDGMHAEVAASVNGMPAVCRALECGAHSVGLLRSEGLYTGSDVPSEDTLYAFYSEILEAMGGGRVIARVCDFGGDNRPGCLSLPPENNPQMGFRSIRMLLSRSEVFMPQLRALLRASVHGTLAILLPMVSTADEVLRARQLLEEARAQLAAEGKPIARRVEFGVMVETPAAAIICDLLARYVDFFCIGTHTLTQFTLVTDRTSMLYTPDEARSKAVLRLIQNAVEQGRRAGIWTSVIGVSAQDPAFLPLFLALGVTLLSVEPEYLVATRDVIRKTDVSAVRGSLLEELSSPILNSRF